TGRVRCTYHDDGQQGGDEEGGDTGETYPGTNLSLTPNIWPKAEDYVQEWDNITVPAGGIFKYTDGNYYVVTSNTTLTKGQALSGPGGDGHSWFSVQKITNRIVTYAEGEGQKSDLTRGDMCLYNGEYYVFKDGGSWGGSPGASPGQWYKIPS
ncbi:MAG: hypothetical protein PHH48_08915, partial [Eubacteriales bacterium]|nr:hypothetical protein [Eubacteriales bacterium]